MAAFLFPRTTRTIEEQQQQVEDDKEENKSKKQSATQPRIALPMTTTNDCEDEPNQEQQANNDFVPHNNDYFMDLVVAHHPTSSSNTAGAGPAGAGGGLVRSTVPPEDCYNQLHHQRQIPPAEQQEESVVRRPPEEAGVLFRELSAIFPPREVFAAASAPRAPPQPSPLPDDMVYYNHSAAPLLDQLSVTALPSDFYYSGGGATATNAAAGRRTRRGRDGGGWGSSSSSSFSFPSSSKSSTTPPEGPPQQQQEGEHEPHHHQQEESSIRGAAAAAGVVLNLDHQDDEAFLLRRTLTPRPLLEESTNHATTNEVLRRRLVGSGTTTGIRAEETVRLQRNIILSFNQQVQQQQYHRSPPPAAAATAAGGAAYLSFSTAITDFSSEFISLLTPSYYSRDQEGGAERETTARTRASLPLEEQGRPAVLDDMITPPPWASSTTHAGRSTVGAAGGRGFPDGGSGHPRGNNKRPPPQHQEQTSRYSATASAPRDEDPNGDNKKKDIVSYTPMKRGRATGQSRLPGKGATSRMKTTGTIRSVGALTPQWGETTRDGGSMASSPAPMVSSTTTTAVAGRTDSSSCSSTQQDQWMKRYQELLLFRSEHGHCNVPFGYKEQPFLAQWIKRQRYQYKCKAKGEHSHMTKEREDILESIGFKWDSHVAAWEEQFSCLTEFHKQNNHCSVPTKEKQLFAWCKRQRRQYRLWVAGEQSTLMTEERVQRMSRLGFSWNALGRRTSGGSGSGATSSGETGGAYSTHRATSIGITSTSTDTESRGIYDEDEGGELEVDEDGAGGTRRAAAGNVPVEEEATKKREPQP